MQMTTIKRWKVLFQGSCKTRRGDKAEQLSRAEPIARALGDLLIRHDFELILGGTRGIDNFVGTAAMVACQELHLSEKERIRTYLPDRNGQSQKGFGLVLKPVDRRWQEVRTFLVNECDAVIALIGGKGTSDSIQKAVLAGKPVFPIAVAGGAAEVEWKKLKQREYFNRRPGDLDFLADLSADGRTIAETVVKHCSTLKLEGKNVGYSRRIFIVHGHDNSLKNECTRLLERLEFQPVILHERPDLGRTIFAKLNAEMSDIGYAFVLFSPDDVGSTVASKDNLVLRARQNVIFEHGLFVGHLGPSRVCAILKGSVEMPSDLHGVLYKHVPEDGLIDNIALEIVKELRAAGYYVDANRL
jgi:predicted nucleotide-binding protein/predicted Rossmann-fold nucleotide-binding protein